MRVKKRPSPWRFASAEPEDFLPRLTETDRVSISSAFERATSGQRAARVQLDSEDWKAIILIRSRYVRIRLIELLSVELPRIFEVAKSVHVACSKLIESNCDEEGSYIFWGSFEREEENLHGTIAAPHTPPCPLSPFHPRPERVRGVDRREVRAIASRLMAFAEKEFAAHKNLEDAYHQFAGPISEWRSVKGSWAFLVEELAARFFAKGLRPTASKSATPKRRGAGHAPPSAFVVLVAEIMWTIHEGHRQHMHGLKGRNDPNPSWAALSFAVSEVLANLRAKGVSRSREPIKP